MAKVRGRKRRKRRSAYCLWCRRDLLPSSSDDPRAATKDHYHPKSQGGTVTYKCCLACNAVKGDLTPAEWDAFRKVVPRWWELYPHTARGMLNRNEVQI